MLIEINDPADPRLDAYRDVRDRDLRGRRNLFLGEQSLVVEQMLRIPGLTQSILALQSHAGRLEDIAGPDIPVYAADESLLRNVVGFNIHRGVLAAGDRSKLRSPSLHEILTPVDRPLTLLICEEIRNIDNIGMLFRNAAAFGVDAVLLSPSCHDPLYRKCLRVSIGHALTVPWRRCMDWDADLELLTQSGVELIATTIGTDSISLDRSAIPQRVGVVVGSEYTGLSVRTIQRCAQLVRIPMAPGVDSLNVGVAAAVCLHRLSRGNRV